MKKTLYILAILWVAVPMWAQQQQVFVYDEESGAAIEGATVMELSEDKTVPPNAFVGETDEYGNLLLPGDIVENAWLQIESANHHRRVISLHNVQADKGAVSLSPRIIQIPAVVVIASASRSKEQLREIPSRVTYISKEDIQTYNPATTAHALENTGEVFVQRSQMGGGSPVIRGFEANKVLIVVDGVRMNNAIYRAGHLQNILSVDANILDHVEVLHGPASVMYGTDAMGGVMHLYTKTPRLFAKGEKPYKINAMTRFATASYERTGHLDMNFGSEKFSSLTSITYTGFSDLRSGRIKSDTAMARYWNRYFFSERQGDSMDVVRVNENPGVQVGTGYWQLDLLQKFRFRPNEKFDFIANFQYSTTSNVPRYDELTRGETTFDQGKIISQTFDFAEWYYGPQSRLFGSLQLRLEPFQNKAFNHANMVVAFQKIDEDRITRRFGDDLRRYQEENVYVFTLNADFVKEFKGKIPSKLLYGIEGTHNIVKSVSFTQNIVTDSISSRGIGTRYPDGGSSMSTAGAYLSYRLHLHRRANIILGARYAFTNMYAKYIDTSLYTLPYDHISSRSHSGTGSVALAWDMGMQWQFNGVVSSSFRNPNLDDFAKIRAKGGQVIVPNPTLKPEKGINAEVSLTKQFSKRVRFSGTFYYTYLFDALIQRPFSLNDADSMYYDGRFRAIFANTNGDRAFIWGINGGISVEFSEAVFMNANINYTRGQVIDDNKTPLGHIPPLYGQLGLQYRRKQFSMNFLVRFNGNKPLKLYAPESEDNIEYALPTGTPAWFVINIYTTYRISKYFSLNLGIENLLDWHYRPFSSGVNASGQNIFIALRGSF